MWKRHVNVALVSRVHGFMSSQFTRRSSQNTPHTFWHTPTHLLAELHQSLQSVCMEADMDSCHSSHLTGWLTVCVSVCVCFPGALPSLASFLAWCSWWVRWRPCACACACAWRMGEGHVLACSELPTSTLWPRAIQVGLQMPGAPTTYNNNLEKRTKGAQGEGSI